MLRAFGLERPSFKLFTKAIGVLFLFGLSVNGGYDAYHLVFLDGVLCRGIDGVGKVVVCLLPLGVFVWIIYHYLKDKFADANIAVTSPPFYARRGVILALSIPKQKGTQRIYTPEEMKGIIDTPGQETLDLVYEIIGFGQLARGVYRHREHLRHVWLLTTNQTEQYIDAFRFFLKKFLPEAEVSFVDDDKQSTRMDSSSDKRIMETAKDIVASILSRKNLERTRLSKSDVIVDISGGTKPITIGMVFGALQTGIDFQYVEQRDNQVIAMQIPVEIVLDKVADYLREIHDAKSGGPR